MRSLPLLLALSAVASSLSFAPPPPATNCKPGCLSAAFAALSPRYLLTRLQAAPGRRAWGSTATTSRTAPPAPPPPAATGATPPSAPLSARAGRCADAADAVTMLWSLPAQLLTPADPLSTVERAGARLLPQEQHPAGHDEAGQRQRRQRPWAAAARAPVSPAAAAAASRLLRYRCGGRAAAVPVVRRR